jgi:uncharacterized protein (TIGR03084 family)
VPTRPTLDEIVTDLVAEHADLDTLVTSSSDSDWDLATPADGWSVRDTISHLAYFDEAATQSMTAPDEFRAGLEQVWADPEGFINAAVIRGRAMSVDDVLAWWRSARTELIDAFRAVDPAARMPWYGPDMGAVSFCTARLMETWAHGQDVADALAVRRAATERLRHVAHIGVQTYRFSFVAQGRDVPPVQVRVELKAPNGSTWAWGPEGGADRVTGSAHGFCLLVTQRRHIDDTDVVAEGPVATEWLSIAQAFAGPAGAGRRPGLPAY